MTIAGSDATSDVARPDLVGEAMVASVRDLRDSFSDVYLQHADGIYRFALERTRSAAVAEDIVGDTMLAALEAIDTYDPSRGSVSAWLFTIARNRIRNHQRAQRRFWTKLSRLWSATDDADELPDLVVRTERAVRVRSALARLSTTDHEVILLRYSGGLTSREISELLGVSDGAIRVRLTRALQRLATELGGIDE